MLINTPQLETKSPTLLTGRAIVAMSLYGLILVVPVLGSMLIVSILPFGPVTFLLPLGTIALGTFFSPMGFGNPYIAKVVGPLQASSLGLETHIVQLTRKPRSRHGLLAILDDADDIGLLSFSESALTFTGDSIRLSVPYAQITDPKLESAGWRALFAYGPQTVFSVSSLPEAGTFSFAERSSWLLPTSRKNARRIFEFLQSKVQAAAASSKQTPEANSGMRRAAGGG